MLIILKVVLVLSLLWVAYSYVIFPALLPLLARFFGRPTAASDTFLPSVGFVVPAHNEEAVIKQKIDNILGLDYPHHLIRVWVGSDRSTDRTAGIVRSVNDERVRLWEAPDRGGKTGIINALVPQLDTEIAFLTDANTMHEAGSLRKLVRHYADPEVGAAAGTVRHVPKGKGDYEETIYRSFEVRQKRLEGVLHSSISAFGGFYTLRTSLFRPIPANAYSNDDVLIPMNVVRQGYRVVFEPEAVSQEDVTESLASEFRRRIRIGAGNFQAFFWLLDFLNPLRGWPAFCYVSHKVTRWFSPVFIVGGYVACGGLAFLAPESFHYRAIFATGLAALIASCAHRLVPFRALRLLFYFYAMNAALLLGGVRYVMGIRSAVWSRTSRTA